MDATALKEMKFRGPVRFLDGAKGMAQQDYEAVDNPRFGYSWRRENRKDKGRQFYTVDGREVADLDEAAKLLAAAPDPESPHEKYKFDIERFRFSPKLNHGATRAENDAQCNADAAPFGTLRAWMGRADGGWHRGINNYAKHQREAGSDFENYRWMYDAKHAAHESYRLMYLFGADREKDTGLTCALGKKCRKCPILAHIEDAMRYDQQHNKFGSAIEDHDIDAAKVWTCLMHVTREGGHPIDGVFVANNRDREAAADEVERWADVARYSGNGGA